MAVELCANCKSRVEEGAVRCASCNADLHQPGIFQVVLGWVVISLSLIPFAVAEVTAGERDLTPIFVGAGIVVLGVIIILLGRAKNRGAAPRVIAPPADAAPQA
jgi:predicted phage tail protein